MFYIIKDEKIVLFDEDKQKLQDTIAFMPQYEGLEIKEVQEGYVIYDFELMTVEEKEEKEAQKERECRNQEIDEKVKELSEMATVEMIKNNKENVDTYCSIINSLIECKS